MYQGERSNGYEDGSLETGLGKHLKKMDECGFSELWKAAYTTLSTHHSTLNFTKRSFLESLSNSCHLNQQVFTVVHSFVIRHDCYRDLSHAVFFLFFIFRNQSTLRVLLTMRLYSFGFDGFEQTRNDNQVKKILFTSWETTVVINGKKKREREKKRWFRLFIL
jgi:hypothetical protein